MSKDLSTTTITVPNGIKKKIIIMNKKNKNYEEENYAYTHTYSK